MYFVCVCVGGCAVIGRSVFSCCEGFSVSVVVVCGSAIIFSVGSMTQLDAVGVVSGVLLMTT